MRTEPTIWWVNRYEHEAIPSRPGIPRPRGYEDFVPRADYDALRAAYDELRAKGKAEYGPDIGGDLEALMEVRDVQGV